MKIFFDMEFTGLHQHTTLVSIGCVDEAGNTLYITLKGYAENQVDEWLQENVIDNLLYDEEDRDFKVVDRTDTQGRHHERYYRQTKEQCRERLLEWLDQRGNQLHMWGDCLAYDWVLLRDLFASTGNWPMHIYYIPFDICTLFWAKGVDADITRTEYAGVEATRHNALADALVIKACYEKLMTQAHLKYAV